MHYRGASNNMCVFIITGKKGFKMRMLLCATLWILCIILECQSEKLKVVGPEAPLVAVAGEDLVLPCYITPNTSAVDMTVEWLKLEKVASLVHLYQNHEDRNEKQVQSYKGRTAVFKEELLKGNASLKILAIQVSDEGEYKCLVEAESWYDDITVQVTVEVLGSHPVITMESYDNSGGINLVCESRGWNPEPQVLWLDREGVTLPAKDTQIHRDTEGFSVKHTVTVYEYSDSNRYYCRLQQKHHMMETEVIINSKVFDIWKWAVGISVSACLIAVVLIILTVIHHKRGSELKMTKQKAEFIKKLLFAVDVTLDCETAHPELILSPDEKQVKRGDTRNELPDTPKRFDHYPCVLGKEPYSLGRFYYEVQVKGKTEWTLGVVKESINRKEWNPRNPQNGFWTVGLRNGNRYIAYDDSEVPLTLREMVEKVGVFVDHEEGLVIFYNLKSVSPIYSFTGQSFTETLYPYFSPRFNEKGDNSSPLIITPVNEFKSSSYSIKF